jgi:hypothetical protein
LTSTWPFDGDGDVYVDGVDGDVNRRRIIAG